MAYNRKDAYYRKAKEAGYRSRAAYKLLELQRRFQPLKASARVVDLGAAPGGWIQVVAEIVGGKGKIVGVDLQAIERFNSPNIALIQGDITDPAVQENVKRLLGGLADCILSDMAPRLSGIRDADIAKSLDLNRAALSVAASVLRPGGTVLIKSFMCDELQAFAAELAKRFASVQRTRPEATRRQSSEVYFCATGFRPGVDGP